VDVVTRRLRPLLVLLAVGHLTCTVLEEPDYAEFTIRCRGEDECPNGWTCKQSFCVDPQGSGACSTPPIGEPCQVGEECGLGGLCMAEVGTDGYCTIRFATQTCCPVYARSSRVPDEEDLVCLRLCDGEAPCRADSGQRCTSDGVCWACSATSGVPVGIGCAEDVDCGPGGTCLPVDLGFTGGACSWREGASECCEPEGRAVRYLEGWLCLQGCTADGDCRLNDGYSCDPLTGACLPVGGAATG